ncbi:unnamed protein product [Anisakis simplex]|uniref:Neur_chan_LBD domain-containing protein n=1 Tax=Anisakis simplex TaxID=6269 RepID=A0A0M3IYD7_ANISI|nr:unnamed protein product [Anisakis simplex]
MVARLRVDSIDKLVYVASAWEKNVINYALPLKNTWIVYTMRLRPLLNPISSVFSSGQITVTAQCFV